MKLALTLLLAFGLVVSAVAKPKGSSRFKLSSLQIQEFDETGWITLSADQKSRLKAKAGVAPTRVKPVYHQPDGEVAEYGYNFALKTSVDEIVVLHEFLVGDDAIEKRLQSARTVEDKSTTTNVPAEVVAKDIPTFAIDAEGKLWRTVARGEFEKYIARDPSRIRIIYFHLPSSMPAKNTVASTDTLRQVTDYSKKHGVPTYNVTEH